MVMNKGMIILILANKVLTFGAVSGILLLLQRWSTHSDMWSVLYNELLREFFFYVKT